MNFIQVQSDTLGSWGKFVKYISANINNHEIIVVPVLLLIIIYSLKYFLGNRFEKKSAIEFGLEFPVDFGFIGITFVITYFFLEIDRVQFGISMVLVSIVIALVTSALRRIALFEFYKDNSSTLALGLYSIINASISILFVLFILSSIK